MRIIRIHRDYFTFCFVRTAPSGGTASGRMLLSQEISGGD
jgi:hypothetical protein